MPNSRAELATRFEILDDETLLERLRGDSLTEEAREVLQEEVARRGLQAPEREDAPFASSPEDLGEMQLLTRAFDPTEAYLLRGLLESEGIPAFVADGNLLQANQLWAPALGFTRVLVPESLFAESMKLLVRFRAGEFTLSDDVDVGEPDPDNN